MDNTQVDPDAPDYIWHSRTCRVRSPTVAAGLARSAPEFQGRILSLSKVENGRPPELRIAAGEGGAVLKRLPPIPPEGNSTSSVFGPSCFRFLRREHSYECSFVFGSRNAVDTTNLVAPVGKRCVRLTDQMCKRIAHLAVGDGTNQNYGTVHCGVPHLENNPLITDN